MPDDVKLIEKCERDIWDIVLKMHRAKVRYEVIYFILVEMMKTLELQAHVENWLEKYNGE